MHFISFCGCKDGMLEVKNMKPGTWNQVLRVHRNHHPPPLGPPWRMGNPPRYDRVMALNGRSFSKGWDAQLTVILEEHREGKQQKVVFYACHYGETLGIHYTCMNIYMYTFISRNRSKVKVWWKTRSLYNRPEQIKDLWNCLNVSNTTAIWLFSSCCFNKRSCGPPRKYFTKKAIIFNKKQLWEPMETRINSTGKVRVWYGFGIPEVYYNNRG